MLDSNAHAESRSSLLAEQPLLSVIVPIYNVAPFLDQCLLSIAAQSYRNLEIICINDGSTDNSLELIQKHAQSDARFRVIDKENQGYGASCNRGLREARGDYVTIVEPDDWIEPDAYRDLLAYAAGFSEEIDIIKSAYWRIVHPDTPRQRKLNCSYKNRVRPPHQPFTPSARHTQWKIEGA